MSNGIDHPLPLNAATTLINRMAVSDEMTLKFSDHALERMDFRNMGEESIRMILEKGIVVRRNVNDYGKWSYRVELNDPFGVTWVVTAIPDRNTLKVVTVF